MFHFVDPVETNVFDMEELNTDASSVADKGLVPKLFNRLVKEKEETELKTVIQQVTVVVDVEVIVVAAVLGWEADEEGEDALNREDREGVADKDPKADRERLDPPVEQLSTELELGIPARRLLYVESG